MIGQPNIFELIEALKDGKDLLEDKKKNDEDEDDANRVESMATEETSEDEQEIENTPPVPSKPYNDYDFTSLEELPEELAPISTIIEIV